MKFLLATLIWVAWLAGVGGGKDVHVQPGKCEQLWVAHEGMVTAVQVSNMVILSCGKEWQMENVLGLKGAMTVR